MLRRDKISIAVSAAIVVVGSAAVYALHAAQPKPATGGTELVTPIWSGTDGPEPTPTPTPAALQPSPTATLVTPGTPDERARENPVEPNPRSQKQRDISEPTSSSRPTSRSRPGTPKPTTPPVRPTTPPPASPTPTATETPPPS